jgi:hypothetical protein
VHAQAIPASGRRDELAEGGIYLFVLRLTASDGQSTARIELPQFTAVPLLLDVLGCLQQACGAYVLPALVVAGCLPSVDATVELSAVTPDPAFIEVNTAPSEDAERRLGPRSAPALCAAVPPGAGSAGRADGAGRVRPGAGRGDPVGAAA